MWYASGPLRGCYTMTCACSIMAPGPYGVCRLPTYASLRYLLTRTYTKWSFTGSSLISTINIYLNLQNAQNNEPYTGYSLYFGILGRHFGPVWSSKYICIYIYTYKYIRTYICTHVGTMFSIRGLGCLILGEGSSNSERQPHNACRLW